MATTMVDTFKNPNSITAMAITNPRPLRVCFSYAAYAKNLIRLLRSENIPAEVGLSESEFADVESSHNFTFPPDLRFILREGLPVGPGFPNWRSSSKEQLDILVNLPVSGICKEVSRKGFWIESWGDRPDNDDRAVERANGFLRKAPVLVPVYRDFYIPSAPCMAGNPVFYVHGGDVSVWSFDIAGFFQQFEFGKADGGGGDGVFLGRPRLSGLFAAPVWAATEARRIVFWTEMDERGLAARSDTRWWWGGELGGCMDEACRILRGGGWREEDVREMVMMDGCDGFDREDRSASEEPLDSELVWLMSDKLLCAGWSREDIVGLAWVYGRCGFAL
ncbi:hypothetical protein CASFOL_015335 [Castilleja foliolosa]|uniref:Uncharacterized protein n=1 Tax=Castilleja foliolosa TaxID=1961234 RepID=A0ABD3DHD7_9LAMI